MLESSANLECRLRSDEVGEETGSWKGGTIGCGYNLKPGETAEECFDRMMLGGSVREPVGKVCLYRVGTT